MCHNHIKRFGKIKLGENPDSWKKAPLLSNSYSYQAQLVWTRWIGLCQDKGHWAFSSCQFQGACYQTVSYLKHPDNSKTINLWRDLQGVNLREDLSLRSKSCNRVKSLSRIGTVPFKPLLEKSRDLSCLIPKLRWHFPGERIGTKRERLEPSQHTELTRDRTKQLIFTQRQHFQTF